MFMSKAHQKTTSSLNTREFNVRIKALGKGCNRALSQKEVETCLAWIDQVLFDYYLVQLILGGKVSLHLPAGEITSVEQLVDVMKVEPASRAKIRLN